MTSRHEVIAFAVKDPIDKTLPNVSGEFIVENPFTGEQLLIEPKVARRICEKHALKQENFVKDAFKNAGADFLSLTTDKPFVFDLISFVQERVKKRVLA